MAYLFKRKDKSGKLLSEFWYIGYTERGQQKQVSSRTTKKTEAQDICDRIYVPIEKNSLHNTNLFQIQMKFPEAISHFKDKIIIRPKSNGTEKAQSSITRDRECITNFKSWCDENDYTEFHEIDTNVINSYVEFLKANKAKNTIVREVRVVKTFFRWCIRKNYIIHNPFEHEDYNRVSGEKIRHQYFTNEELQKVFDATEGIYKDVIQLLYYTGLRIGELLLTEWQDYVQQNAILRLRVQEGGKTKKLHNIMLNQKACAILDSLQQVKGSNTKIFEGVEYQSLTYYLKKVYKELNLVVDQVCHIYRHTAASHLALHDVSILVIKDFLRHSTIEQSLVYAELSPKKMKESIEILNQLG